MTIQHARKNIESIRYALLVDRGQNNTEDVWPHMGNGQVKRGRLFFKAPPPMELQKNETCLTTESCIPRDTPNGPIWPVREQRERVCYSGNSGAHCAHIIPTSEIMLGPGT